MSNWAWNPNDDLEDDDDEEHVSKFTGRDGTIYLVDVDQKIAGDPDDFFAVLECIEAGLLNGIIMNDRDLYGVVFYNTLQSPPSKDSDKDADLSLVVPKNTAVFMPLKPLTKDSIQYFKNFKASDDFFDFKNKYGSSTNSSFSEALWLCSRLFMSCGYKLYSTTIVLFTSNEQPHAPGSAELNQAFVRAADLQKNEVDVIVVPMVDEFDMEPFFKEFICSVKDQELETFRCLPPDEQRQDMLNRIYQKDYRKSCQRYLNVTLAEGLEFGCGVYSFTKTTKLPSSVKILRDSNDVIVAKRSYMCEEFNEETGEMEFKRRMMPGELFKCQEIGGKEIIFSSEELAKMKSLITPGIRILGFKPIERLPERCFVKKLAFLYPSENYIKGSTKLFRALWEKCLEKKQFMLCALTYRRKVAPRYAALVPQTDQDNGHDGFRIVFLPMITDFNHLDVLEKEAPEVSPACEELLKKLCRKLRFQYRPHLFANPHFQQFYTQIEALVFDESKNSCEDSTLPNTAAQDSKIQGFIDQITEAFGRETFGVKRPAGAAAGDGGRSKAAKKDLTHEEIEQAVRNGRVEIVTVQHLKDYLVSQGIPIPQKAVKKDLVEAIKQRI